MHTTCCLILLLSISCEPAEQTVKGCDKSDKVTSVRNMKDGVYSIKMTPGSKAQVICSLEDVTVVTWYQQLPKEQPIAILTYNRKSFLPPKYLNGFTSKKMKASSESSKLALTIEEVTENDCGTYYCTKKVDDHNEFGEPNSLTFEDTSVTTVHSDVRPTRMDSDNKLPSEEDLNFWKYCVVGLLLVIALLIAACMILCMKMKTSKTFHI